MGAQKRKVERGSPEEAALARSLCERVGLDADGCVGTAARFLRARGHDMSKADALLRGALKWRARARPETLVWEDVEHEMKTGKMYRADFRAADGLPTILMRPRNENTKDHEGNIRNLVYTLESARTALEREETAAGRSYPEAVSRFRWIIDFKGYSLRNAPPIKTSRETLRVLQDCYPESLGEAVLWDPPRIFYAFWRIISPFIEARTRGKIVFCFPKQSSSQKAGDKGSELLQQLYTPEQLAALGLCPSGKRIDDSYDHAAYAARMRAEDALKRTPAPDADGDIFFDASDACHAQGDKAAGSADVVSTV